MMRSKKVLITFFFSLVFDSNAALIVESPFSFGKIAVTDNTSVSTVQITRSGTTSSTNKIFILEAGTPGVYTLTDLSPFSTISTVADVPSFSASPIPGTQQFTLRSVDITTEARADATGTAQFAVSGLLEKSGLGGTYIGPASYEITLTINTKVSHV